MFDRPELTFSPTDQRLNNAFKILYLFFKSLQCPHRITGEILCASVENFHGALTAGCNRVPIFLSFSKTQIKSGFCCGRFEADTSQGDVGTVRIQYPFQRVEQTGPAFFQPSQRLSLSPRAWDLCTRVTLGISSIGHGCDFRQYSIADHGVWHLESLSAEILYECRDIIRIMFSTDEEEFADVTV